MSRRKKSRISQSYLREAQLLLDKPISPVKKILRRTVACLLAVFFIWAGLTIYVRQSREIKRLTALRSTLENQLSSLEQEGTEIKELQELYGSDEYVEQVARDKLGLIRPEEIIFIH